MKIFLLTKKADLTQTQIEKLALTGELVIHESKEQLLNDTSLYLPGDKVLALEPILLDWELPTRTIEKIPTLKVICLPTTGYGFLEIEKIKKLGIAVSHVPNYSTRAVSEWCLWAMLSLAKKIPLIQQRKYELDWGEHLGSDVFGKKAGIIGFGDIGSRVAQLCKAIGLSVSYWSQKSRTQEYTYQELKPLISTSDFLFVTVKDGEETKNLLTSELLSLTNKSTCIINISGNSVWDLTEVVSRVQNGKLGGIAIDGDESPAPQFSSNIISTPHIAWYTKESLQEDIRLWIENIVSAAQGTPTSLIPA